MNQALYQEKKRQEEERKQKQPAADKPTPSMTGRTTQEKLPVIDKTAPSRARAAAREREASGSVSSSMSRSDVQAPEKWYSGNSPTNREVLARIYTIGADDPQMGQELLDQYSALSSDPRSPSYQPYKTATNKALIDRIADLGVDVSGGINDDFFAQNAGLMQNYRLSSTGATNTPQAPTKSSTPEQNAAYYYYQLYKDEETTKKAENEWEQMQKEIRYWTRKGLSDDEIIAKVNARTDNYKTLFSMDKNAAMGTPTLLNRPVGYSQDNLYGVIWSERNGDTSDDYERGAVLSVLGKGKGYSTDYARQASRDRASDSYHPYKYGNTGLDDASIYFGVDTFDDSWLKENAALLNSGDKKAAKYYEQVYAANQNAKAARDEMVTLKDWARAQLNAGLSADIVKKNFEERYTTPSLDDEKLSLKSLRALDKGREIGNDPVDLTFGVDYRKEDFLRWLDGQGSGKRTRQEAIAAQQTDKGRSKENQAFAGNNPNEQEVAKEDNGANAQAEASADNEDMDALRRERDAYVEQYNALLHAGQSNLLSVDREGMAQTLGEIDRLSEMIGDGYTVKTPYTEEEARSALSSVMSGKKLTEEEKRVFDSFYADNPYLFPHAVFSHDESDASFLEAGAAQMIYGKTASEALTYADSADATSAEAADTMLRVAMDYQSAQSEGMSLDQWYEQNPHAMDELMSVKAAVEDRREMAAAEEARKAEEQQAAQLEYTVNIMARTARGEPLTQEESEYYQTAVAGQTDGAILSNDDGLTSRYWQLAENMENGEAVKKLGLSGPVISFALSDCTEFVKSYLMADAKLAASCGMTLDEMYEKYPYLEKSEDELYERARQDYNAKWNTDTVQDSGVTKEAYENAMKTREGLLMEKERLTSMDELGDPGDRSAAMAEIDAAIANEDAIIAQYDEPTDEKRGLGFFTSVGLGVSSGAQSWWAGKVGFAAMMVDQNEAYTSSQNYQGYVAQYGLGDARYYFRQDVTAAVAAMDDNDPNKASYQEMLSSDKDIFTLPFNFTYQYLADCRRKINENIQANADLVQTLGTEADQTVYNLSTDFTQNSLLMGESAIVNAVIPGSSAIGVAAAYGTAEMQDTYFSARERGATRDQAKALGGIHALSTVLLETSMYDAYVGNKVDWLLGKATGNMKRGLTTMIDSAAAAGGKAYLAKAGRIGVELLENAVGEGVQENVENIVGGAIDALWFKDPPAFLETLKPTTIKDTFINSAVTSMFLSAEGQGFRYLRARTNVAAEERGIPGNTPKTSMQDGVAQGDQELHTGMEGGVQGQIGAESGILADTEQNGQSEAPESGEATSDALMEKSAEYMNLAVEAALTDPELQQELVDACAANILQDRIGQGALNTEQTASLAKAAEQPKARAETTKATAKAWQAKAEKLAAAAQAFGNGNQLSAGAQETQRTLETALQNANVKYASAQTEAQQAAKAAEEAETALQDARREAYLTAQQSARAQAQQEVTAMAQEAEQALWMGETERAEARFNSLSEEERVAALLESTLTVAPEADEQKLSAGEVERLENSTKRDARRYVSELMKKFGVLKRYKNLNAQIEFDFTKSGSDESIHKQSDRNRNMGDFARMLSQMDSIVENAVPIETHTDKYAGTRRSDPLLDKIYVFLSAYAKGNNLIPVQLEVKTFKDQGNRLYMAVTLNETAGVGLRDSRTTSGALGPTTSAVSETAGLGDGLPSVSQQRTASPTTVSTDSIADQNDGVNTSEDETEAAGLGLAQHFSSDEQRSNKATAASTIRVADLIAAVNPSDGDFLKYVPDDLLSEAQKEGKRQALEKEQARIDGMRLPTQAQAQRSETGLVPEDGSIQAAEQWAYDVGNGSVPPNGAEVGPAQSGSQEGPQRQFGSQTAQRSEAIDQETRDWLYEHSGYTSDSNKAQINRAIRKIEEKGLNNTLTEWLAKADNDMGNSDDQAIGVTLMGLAARSGDVNQETIIADKYNRIGTVLGQGLQARKIFNMMTPLGAQAYVRKVASQVAKEYGRGLSPLNITVSEETMKRIGEAKTLEERQDAVDAAQKEIARQIPPTIADWLNGWRYLAMLGNPRTHIRNVVGNGVFVPEVAVRDNVSAVIQAVAKKAGWINETTLAVGPARKEYRDFAETDVEDKTILKCLKDGEKYATDRKLTGGAVEKERRSFGNSLVGRALQKAADFNSKMLGAEDMLFKKGYYKRALASYLQANNIDLSTASNETLDAARNFAINEAMVNTYNNVNKLIGVLSDAERKLRSQGNAGKGAAVILEGIVPFKNTPANIIARGVEYSPVGLVETVTLEMRNLKRGNRLAEEYGRLHNGESIPLDTLHNNGGITANEFIDRLSSGLTGTGTFALGMLLRSAGIITGSMGNDDEDKFAKMNGEQEYALKIYDNDGNAYSYTLDWLAPGGLSMFTGADFYDMMQEGGVTLENMYDSLKNLSEPAFNLTMLDGLNDIFDAGDTAGFLEKSVTGYLGQFVPTILGQIARTIDPVRRNNYTDKNRPLPTDWQYFINKQINKIPGLSSVLSTPYVNALGEQDRTDSFLLRAFENFLSPGYINRITTDETTEMLDRVAEESGDTGVYPKSSARYITANKQRYDLSAEEWTRYQTDAGQSTKQAMDFLTTDPDFAGLEPYYQAEAIKAAVQWASKTAQEKIVQGVTKPAWMDGIASPEDAARKAVEREAKNQRDDAGQAAVKGIAEYAADGNVDACMNLMAAYYEMGYTVKEAQSDVASAVKDTYMKAYKAGDMDVTTQIKQTLGLLGIGIGDRIKAWERDEMKKEAP